MAETLTIEDTTAYRGVAGAMGMAVAVGLAVILAIHPPGDTSLRADSTEFLDHVSGYWIGIHLAVALLLVAFPVAAAARGDTMRTPPGRVRGRLTGMVALTGVAVGVSHCRHAHVMGWSCSGSGYPWR